MSDVTNRFSDRVADYERHRPGYPAAAVALICERCGLRPGDRAADVGSGTGKLTRVLLDAGLAVWAVEPNPSMRRAAEALLGDLPGFASVDGRAEATTLPPASVDLVTAAQAFHWFDREAARVEFRRILRPKGHVALLWNERIPGSPFARDYDALLEELSVDYAEVGRRRASSNAAVGEFLVEPEQASFDNPQQTDFPGLVGRYLSASYAFRRDDPRFPGAEAALRRLFERHARDGAIVMPLSTQLYWGSVLA
jgi:ubiquinone/menaquinone biosynthesis C-methylase UbiE